MVKIEFIFLNGDYEYYVAVDRPEQREKSYWFKDPDGVETEVLRDKIRSISVSKYEAGE